MNNENKVHMIFGTGPLGKAVMRELVKQGQPVRMVNRSGKAQVSEGVEVVAGDATNLTSARSLCTGAAVVYQCAQPEYTRWVTEFPAYQAAVIEGAAANTAKLVVAENLYMYGQVNGPLKEDLPFRPNTRKGMVRAKMAEDLMAAHKAGKVRAVAGRASDFYGPEAGQQGIFGDRIIYPMLAGKKAGPVGNPDLPHTYSYVSDFGRSLVRLGSCDEAFGQAWHIPNAPTLTTREMLNMFFEEAGLPPRVAAVPDLVLKMVGLFNPVVREVTEMLYEFNQPFVVDHSKYERAFGNTATPHREAIKETLAWFKANQPQSTH